MKWLWYVWGFGSWKSFIWCLTGVYLSFLYPKNLWIIGRSTLVDLKNTTRRTFFEICGMLGLEEGIHYQVDKHESRLTFENGSEIIFTGLDDINKLKGMEPGWFYIDEVDDVDPEVFKILQRRLRNKYSKRRIGFVTSNSEGKNWTYQTFIAWQWIPEDYKKTYYTIRASSLENKNLPDDYIDNLLSFEEDYFKRYVLGEFNVFEGQIYDEFMQSIHVVDDFEIPDWRDIAYWHDHWLSNPTAILEWRMSHDWELFITREHYHPGKTVKYHTESVKERWAKMEWLLNQPLFISDPSIFAKTQLPTPERPYPWSIADEYMEQGISPTRGNNSVLAGINRIKELLKLQKIFIFKSCKHTINEIMNYKREKNRMWLSKEAPMKKNDHACDALRYLIMAKLPPARKTKAPGMMTIEELVASDIRQINNPEKYQQDYDFI